MGFLGMGEKAIDKITSEKEKLEQANELTKNTKEVDLQQLETINSLNLQKSRFTNPRHWLEVICVIGFAYTFLIAPMVNDIFHINLHGAGKETAELLYALLGLGGYRLAGKVVKR